MAYRLHTFRPGETITAVIRLLGRHDLSPWEIANLLKVFDQLNSEKVPKVGETFKIPLPEDQPDDRADDHAGVQSNEEL
jgi:hypothetical protein